MALNGTPNANTLSARFDNDQVYGLGGQDTLTSYGYNNTYLDGGDDNDQLLSNVDLANLPSNGQFILTQVGGLGNDTLMASIYEPQQPVNTNADEITVRMNLTGGDGIDNITEAIAPVDWTYSLSSIWGGIGDDSIRVEEAGNGDTKYSTAQQTIRAGDGNDSVVINTNGGFWNVTNDIQGQAGNDVIFANAIADDWDGVTNTAANNTISGGTGDDIIQATAQGIYDAYETVGYNYINGDAGNDRIDATSWHYNELYGGVGNDVISATLIEEIDLSRDTSNILDGGDGNDFLSATGRVHTYGYDSDNGPDGSGLTQTLTGGAGNDTLQASALVDYFFRPGTAHNNLFGGDGNDNLIGVLQGETLGANQMYGQLGNDRLQSRGGADNLLNGGAGRDLLIAGTGTDNLIGGSGNDTFRFNSTTDSNRAFRDTVQGFDGDRFDLSRMDANEDVNGVQDFIFGRSHAEGHLWAVDVGNRTIIRGNTDADAAADFELAIQDGNVDASYYSAIDFLF